jgi:molybdopterin molybdotransferase
VEVFQQPKVAIISTGDEVVEVNANPGPHQIRNSNSFSLAAQVLAAGGEPVQLPIAPDEPRVLRDLIARGLQAELLLLSGGVSMGKHDHVEQVLREFDVEFFFTGALIQPGRPIVFGRAYNKERKPGYFFGLPGNPVSTMVTFKLFAAPLIQALAAAEPKPLSFVRVKLKSEVRTKTGLTRFLPAHLTGEGAQTFVELLPWQGSGDIVSVASADCFAVIPPDRDRIEAGEMLPVLLT